MHSDEIGIIMPVKNAAVWLEACLESICAQTYPHWKLYAVDDGSFDESYTLLKEYASKDARVCVFKNKGCGIVDALCTGYLQSTEPYITRMDADDLMPPGKLAWLYYAVSQNQDRVVTGKVTYFSDKPISEGYLRYENWLNNRVINGDFEQHMYRECVIASGNWMCCRDTLEKVGAFEFLHYPEDYDLVFRWYTARVKFLGINKFTHYWREHELRTSRNSANYNQNAFFNLKLFYWVKLECKENNSVVLLGEGVKANLAKKLLAANGVPYRQVGQEEKEDLLSLANYKATADDKVLICVYPRAEIREVIEKVLTQKGLLPGVNWWYV